MLKLMFTYLAPDGVHY